MWIVDMLWSFLDILSLLGDGVGVKAYLYVSNGTYWVPWESPV